jgi:hypothetical protein
VARHKKFLEIHALATLHQQTMAVNLIFADAFPPGVRPKTTDSVPTPWCQETWLSQASVRGLLCLVNEYSITRYSS